MSIEERLWSLKLASRAQVIFAEYERTRQSRVLPYHIQGGRELAQFARRVAEQSRASFSFSLVFSSHVRIHSCSASLSLSFLSTKPKEMNTHKDTSIAFRTERYHL